jgi:transcriptional regulator with XRE-family HTH domain
MRHLKRDGGARRHIARAVMSGDDLRKRRVDADLTQAELATLAGYHYMYISILERGARPITKRTARLLCSVIAAHVQTRSDKAPDEDVGGTALAAR